MRVLNLLATAAKAVSKVVNSGHQKLTTKLPTLLRPIVTFFSSFCMASTVHYDMNVLGAEKV